MRLYKMPLAGQMLPINLSTAYSSQNIDYHPNSNNATTTFDSSINYNIRKASNSILASHLSNISGIVGINNATLDTWRLVENTCVTPREELLDSHFGVKLAVSEREAILTTIVLSLIIALTIVGNILVILSVFTYKPLCVVQNFFIASLAVADLTVALLVLPLNVAYSILGRWKFGIYLCKMWLTCDIMCCTSSILNLCAIALDRYWAITDPINYAQKRTISRVLFLIAGVWILSLLISCPPLLGWNDWPEEFTSETPCELNSDPGYVIYSALGSFFIPFIIMATVYIEIFTAIRRRLRERVQADKINSIAAKFDNKEVDTTTLTAGYGKSSPLYNRVFCCCRRKSYFSSIPMIQNDQESNSSETQAHNKYSQAHDSEHSVVALKQLNKTRKGKFKDFITYNVSKPYRNSQFTNNELNPTKVTEFGSIEDRSLCSHNEYFSGKKLLFATELESGSKQYMHVFNANQVIISDKDEENISLKVTPPQSSIDAVSLHTTPVQKKSAGVYQFIEEKQKISLSKERRAARTLGIIMGAFVICWLPFFLMYIVLPFCSSCCPTKKFKNFITWLGYINSVLNPIIYTIYNIDYRRAFKRLLGLN